MSGPKWTPAQRAAIEDRGGALLVSAAAGSGKTAVLTERAVRLITDPDHPVDADKLLIVTFTNAAAAELRARIGQALLRLSQQQPHNTSLRRQRMLLQRAPICTIDAFCLNLLHKHFQALDIPPDFAPADPGSVEVLRASALAETLENAYRDPDFCAFADLYGKGRTDQAAGNTILHVYDFLRALPDYDRRLDEYLTPWQRENGFAFTCWHDLLLAEAARCAKAARELLTAALADCKEDFVLAQAQAEEKGKTAASKAKAVAGVNDKFAEPLSRLESAAALLGEVERLAAAGQWTPLYDKLTPYVLGMEEIPGFKGMKKRLTGDHKAAVRTRADEAAKLFEQAGCDSMHLRLGPLGHHVAQFGADLYFILNGIEGCTGFGTQYDFSKNWQGMLIGNTSGCGIGLNVAAEYKKALSIPCGVVTYNDPAHAPDFFEQALEDGKADFFLMTRPLTVDMEYVNKLKEGRIDEIAPCTRCLHCHIGSNEANAQMAYCRVNALTQRVMREGGPATYELEPAATPKKVMVIGGGPAGMEAARIAAARGHNVTLYEKRGALGFMLDFAASVKGPHENLADLKNYLIRQLELNGVEVKTGTEVTQELINSEAPDAVILAAGGLRDTLTVDGDGSAPVVEMDNFMFTEMGDNVIVYGSNAQAFDAALWLTVHKKNVTIVTPNPASEFDMQQSQHAMRMMTTALYALGVKSYPQSAIKTVSGNVATLTLDSGVEMNIKCDAIVNGADMLPNTSLVDGIDCKEVYTIGDCANPFNIALAIRGGNDAGRAV